MNFPLDHWEEPEKILTLSNTYAKQKWREQQPDINLVAHGVKDNERVLSRGGGELPRGEEQEILAYCRVRLRTKAYLWLLRMVFIMILSLFVRENPDAFSLKKIEASDKFMGDK